jgi:hypothetical protein
MPHRCETTAHPKHEYELRNKHAPIHLGLRRPRALTPPLPQPSTLQRLRARLTKQRQVMHDQLQSILYKLPFEIREQIWKHVIAEKPIVLVHLSKRLAHFRCSWDGTGTHGCCQGDEWKAGSMRKPMSFAPRPFDKSNPGMSAKYDSTKLGLLSLLKTCRRMYVLYRIHK